jgi:hypothetical protein
VVGLWGKGELSIYTFHGRNTYDREHHMMIARHCGLPKSRLRRLLRRLQGALADYDLSGEVKLCTGSGTPLAIRRGSETAATHSNPSAAI